MLSASCLIDATPERVFDFVTRTENFWRLLEHQKYEVDIADDGFPPGFGKVTECSVRAGKISFRAFCRIIEFKPGELVRWHCVHRECRYDGVMQTGEMPEFIVGNQLSAEGSATRLRCSMSLTGRASFFNRIYFWLCLMLGYRDLRRYLRFVQNSF